LIFSIYWFLRCPFSQFPFFSPPPKINLLFKPIFFLGCVEFPGAESPDSRTKCPKARSLFFSSLHVCLFFPFFSTLVCRVNAPLGVDDQRNTPPFCSLPWTLAPHDSPWYSHVSQNFRLHLSLSLNFESNFSPPCSIETTLLLDCFANLAHWFFSLVFTCSHHIRIPKVVELRTETSADRERTPPAPPPLPTSTLLPPSLKTQFLGPPSSTPRGGAWDKYFSSVCLDLQSGILSFAPLPLLLLLLSPPKSEKEEFSFSFALKRLRSIPCPCFDFYY